MIWALLAKWRSELYQSNIQVTVQTFDIDDEDEGVVLLHLLHGALSVERVNDDLVLIKTGLVRDRLSGVLGRSGEHQGLGAVEGGGGSGLDLLVGVGLAMGISEDHGEQDRCCVTYALESSLGSSVGLLGALGGGYMEIHISNRSFSELAKSAAA